MVSLLFSASLSGSLVVLIWRLLLPIEQKLLSPSCNYNILKTAMCFMILPIGMVTSFLKENLQLIHAMIASAPSEEVLAQNASTPTAYAAFDSSVSSAVSSIMGHGIGDISIFATYLPWVWFLVAGILFGIELFERRRFHRSIMGISQIADNQEMCDLFVQCKNEMGFDKSVSLRTSKIIETPLSIGLLKPTIIFPETSMDLEGRKFAFIHELTHIKNKDLWVKMLASIICILHWYNPLSYVLRKQINLYSEMYCDQCMIEKMTMVEKAMYGRLILSTASIFSPSQTKMCSPFSTGNHQQLKRRLAIMLNGKQRKRKIIGGIAIVMALVVGSLGAMFVAGAYSGEEAGAPVIDVNEDVSVISTVDFTESLGFDSNKDAGAPVLVDVTDAGVTDKDNAGGSVGRPSGSLAPGAGYRFARQYLYAGNKVTVTANSYTPTSVSISLGVYWEHNDTDYTTAISGGSGSVAWNIKTDGWYKIVVLNTSGSNVDFNVSYIVN